MLGQGLSHHLYRSHDVLCSQAGAQPAPSTGEEATTKRTGPFSWASPAHTSGQLHFRFCFLFLSFLKTNKQNTKPKSRVHVSTVYMNVPLWCTFSLASKCRFLVGIRANGSSRAVSDSAWSSCLTLEARFPPSCRKPEHLGKLPVRWRCRCSNCQAPSPK